MIPKAKKNLHACKYHMRNLLGSKHFEEVEINFAAFVNSARNTTFVLQKEFKKTPGFIDWYGNPDKPEEAKEGTRLHQMKNDELCKFFLNLRSKIAKEGMNALNCSTTVRRLHTGKDFPDKLVGATLAVGNKGIYYHVKKGTPQEDKLPAITSGDITTNIFIAGAPTQHLGETIPNPNLVSISELYYEYLKNLVEEWTGIMNSSD